MILKYFKRDLPLLFFTLAIISCPSTSTKEIIIEKIPEFELLNEAERAAQARPLYAFELLKKVTSPTYKIDKIKILLKIYLAQKEYALASFLLDSLKNEIDIKGDPLLKYLCLKIYLNQKDWEGVLNFANDPILKGIALYNLQRYNEAIEYFSCGAELDDYRSIYLSRCYFKLNDFQKALNTILNIDSVSLTLAPDYQNLLFDILLNTADISIIKKELSRLKDPVARKFLLVKLYERQKDDKNVRSIGLDLIHNHPSSTGAKYCITILKPKDRFEYKAFGKVAFIHNDYEQAVKFLKNAVKDSDVNYYLGKLTYNQQQYNVALNYFKKSQRPEAYYYRAMIYENWQDYGKAIMIYDSLINRYKNSKYATNGMKRKAFLLEEIGDTTGAVETFIKVKEKNASFRAGFQMFRKGELDKAMEIFSNYKEPDFIYWQIKIKERMGESTDSLKDYLFKNYPLSYYTLVKDSKDFLPDTTPLDAWLRQLGDTTITFDRIDSVHLKRADRYFSLNESNYAFNELQAIEDKSLFDLVFLSRLCAENGYEYGAIKFCLEFKKRLEKNNDSRNYPVEFLRLLYPVRYLFTIKENSDNIWLTLAMIWQESMFDPDAKSIANAQGLMQIIPSTGRLIANELGITNYSLYDPMISIKFGTHYFSKMLNEFNTIPLALSAYNAGPVILRKWLKKNSNVELDEFIELIPFAETRSYLRFTLVRQIIYRRIWESLLE